MKQRKLNCALLLYLCLFSPLSNCSYHARQTCAQEKHRSWFRNRVDRTPMSYITVRVCGQGLKSYVYSIGNLLLSEATEITVNCKDGARGAGGQTRLRVTARKISRMREQGKIQRGIAELRNIA